MIRDGIFWRSRLELVGTTCRPSTRIGNGNQTCLNVVLAVSGQARKIYNQKGLIQVSRSLFPFFLCSILLSKKKRAKKGWCNMGVHVIVSVSVWIASMRKKQERDNCSSLILSRLRGAIWRDEMNTPNSRDSPIQRATPSLHPPSPARDTMTRLNDWPFVVLWELKIHHN